MSAVARETLEVILAHIRARLSPLAIYVFGSRATGRAQPGSDLDIAVLGPAPYDPWTLFMLSEELLSLQEQNPQNGPPSELDLLDLNAHLSSQHRDTGPTSVLCKPPVLRFV
ncbi:nucleotidyltransferase family protein [Meiothermus hypogaeus]|uniref:Polymerase beta nucleotidyltransferase domain-containing protein n=1 Tax=Meiothermus hypogaeus NBRC 106114 TaxID=1227553 RepID=A0A511R4W9_9DEIN|nr:nucleotidyltransferase domain-containing protein [Meiothermus hypogaeus]GEM84650.1 hypothetical protein MHY01S_28160 [Meiothermus hypogaeus NBRC 106114]